MTTTTKLAKKTSISSAIILVVMMMLFSLFIGNLLNITLAYFFTFLVYWFLFCIPISYYCLGGINGIKAIYAQPKKPGNNEILFTILAFLPCIATFYVIFINIYSAPSELFIIAASFALINGVIEELFWRGVFITLFPKNILFGYILPALLFGLWHIALFFSKGIVYQGGFISLVGGSMFMGFLWGFIAYQTKSIKAITIAHVITNFFAFSGLIYRNWFMP